MWLQESWVGRRGLLSHGIPAHSKGVSSKATVRRGGRASLFTGPQTLLPYSRWRPGPAQGPQACTTSGPQGNLF